jgi:hypothetical protein
MTAMFAGDPITPSRSVTAARALARRDHGWRDSASGFGVVACGLLLATMLWAAHRPAAPKMAAPPFQGLAWTDVARPEPLFGLTSGIFGERPALYEAWTAAAGAIPGAMSREGRRDALTYGAFAADEAFLRLFVEQAKAADANQPFFSDLARQAALAGLFVERSEAPVGQPSRFSALSVAEAWLAAGTRSRTCLMFRNGDSTTEISGLACASVAAAPLASSAIACVLNGLQLVRDGAQAATVRYFENAPRFDGCPKQGSAADRLASNHSASVEPHRRDLEKPHRLSGGFMRRRNGSRREGEWSRRDPPSDSEL